MTSKTAGGKKLLKDISANTIQTGITQVFALIIFYITSKYFSKSEYGEFNWSMAIGSTIITFASLGLDAVFVKRVASGQDVLLVSSVHFFHTFIVGVVLCLSVLGINLFSGSFGLSHPLFLLVFINLSLMNIGNSFKLCLTGLESYRYLAFLAFFTSVFKFFLIVFLYTIGYFTISNVILTFIVASALELILGYYFVTRAVSAGIKPILHFEEYKYFIIESLPQFGVVVFDAALARIDWIILGIISTASITAEYSFVYRMFESSRIPLIIIGPILLTRFSKLLGNPEKIEEKSKQNIQLFFKLELFVVMIIPIILICVWADLIDYLTDNKYGEVNTVNYILLAGGVPLHCINNFLWSMGFAQGQLKVIMYIIIATALINFGMNCFLIPAYGSLGASIAFIISTLLQTSFYIKYINQTHIKLDLKVCLIAFLNAILSILAAKCFTNNAIFAAVIAIVVSIAFAFITNQLSIQQLKRLLRP